MTTKTTSTFTPCYDTADRDIPFLIYFETTRGIYAFPYGHLLDVYASPLGGGGEVITLRFSTTVVSLEGKNLQKILECLGSQKLTKIRMLPGHHQLSKSKSEPIITKITTKRNGEQYPQQEDKANHEGEAS